MSAPIPTAQTVTNLQKELVAKWHASPPAAGLDDRFLRLVEENSLRNFILWHHEDEARRDDLGSEHVHQAKRAIDAANQQRNDFVEKMDQALFAVFHKNFGPDTVMNTETPGMTIDRLSILSLKEYHMREQTLRGDATQAHKESCQRKLDVILQQIADLQNGLQQLLDDCASGARGFRVYFQFKMYNDPALNPALYSKR